MNDNKNLYLYDSCNLDCEYLLVVGLFIVQVLVSLVSSQVHDYLYLFDGVLSLTFYYQLIIIVMCYSSVVFHTNSSNNLIKYFLEPLNTLLGLFLFGKLNVIRNFPKWDIIVLRLSVPFSMVVFMNLKYLGEIEAINQESKWIYVFSGAFYVASLWQIYNRKSSQYNTCYETAGKYMEEKTKFSPDFIKIAKNKDPKDSKITLLRVNKLKSELFGAFLSLDLIHFDLWNHKSFSLFFSEYLRKVFKFYKEPFGDNIDVDKAKELLKKYSMEVNNQVRFINNNDLLILDEPMYESLIA